MLRRERPSLMVLDLMLPGRDGWELTRTVRSDPSLAATPIIMVTARVEHADRVLGLEPGADDYVPKPFNPREIVARVRADCAHLGRGAGADGGGAIAAGATGRGGCASGAAR